MTHSAHPIRSRLLAMLAIPVLLAVPLFIARAAGPQAHAHATVDVAIQNFAFSPATLTVAPGTTVTWTNKDGAAHTVTSDSGAWPDSGNLATGKSFSFTFTKGGTYAYHCAIYPFMTAKVI